MDDHAHPDDEYDSVRLNESESATYTGAFFPNSRHLVVKGGTFTNNTISSPPADYLRISLGSIDLRNKIRLDEPAGVASRNHGRGVVRRLYSAWVGCHNKPMTVALYQGDHAEEVRFIFERRCPDSSSGMAGECFHPCKPPTSTHSSNLCNCELIQNPCYGISR
ncbi:hypothetical protein C8R45DRAFT_278815 [Mycena sanguinolenta]|nr:hypothetical protein C8R45DRAFT_278815 [Mycena sanguinolenta]